MMKETNLAIFVSGNGSNCESLIRHFHDSEYIHVVMVVSSNPNAFALVRAKNLGVPTTVVDKKNLADSRKMLDLLRTHRVDFIVLAGFLMLIPEFLIDAFPRRIINLHPALLPKFGGKGMYGKHVHEAVKAAGETVTGMTVHYVDRKYDNGDVIAQRTVALNADDTADDIAAKEHDLEMKFFPEIVEKTILGCDT